MRDYVADLMMQAEVRTVKREVDPRFELAAVTQAAQATGEAALIFRNVRGSDFQVVTNLFGSRSRLCDLIGADDGNYCRRWAELSDRFDAERPQPTREVAAPTDLVAGKLSDLPLITYFERDAGPYFTAAIMLAREPETGVANLSFHRAMYVADDELRVRLGETHDLARYFAKAEAMDRPLEVAMLIGAPPEIFLAAAASLPYDADELCAAAMVAGAPIDMRPCRTIGLSVPAATEIVVEGRLLPKVRRPEGPFGEFMGMYVPEGEHPVLEVLDVSWRDGAMFHSLLSGSPEDMRPLEVSIAARIYRHLSAQLPGIVDVSCHPTLLNTTVQIRNQYDGHARHVLLAAFGAHLDYSKACMVVDEDVDIHDLNDVMWAYLTRGRADRRAFIVEDVPGFFRDPHRDHWGRLAIDATMPFGRQAEFERKRIPGADATDLDEYLF